MCVWISDHHLFVSRQSKLWVWVMKMMMMMMIVEERCERRFVELPSQPSFSISSHQIISFITSWSSWYLVSVESTSLLVIMKFNYFQENENRFLIILSLPPPIFFSEEKWCSSWWIFLSNYSLLNQLLCNLCENTVKTEDRERERVNRLWLTWGGEKWIWNNFSLSSFIRFKNRHHNFMQII